MPSVPYYEALSQDADKLGVSNCPTEAPRSFSELHSRLSSFGQAASQPEKLIAVNKADLQTQVGHKTLQVASSNIATPKRTDLNLCEWVEHYTLTSFDTRNMNNPSRPTPIILTDNDIAVAILKHYEYQNVYGLEDRPEYGLFEGFVHNVTESDFELNPPANINLPWRVDISHLHLTPGRPTAFTIPLGAREFLLENSRQKRVLTAEHAMIVGMANEHLKSTNPYTPKY